MVGAGSGLDVGPHYYIPMETLRVGVMHEAMAVVSGDGVGSGNGILLTPSLLLRARVYCDSFCCGFL